MKTVGKNNRLMSPSKQQFGVVFAFQISVDQIRQQLFQDTCGIFHLPLQRCHDKRCNITTITHGEGPAKTIACY